MIKWVTTPEEFCSGGDCVQVSAIGGDWFRVRSSAMRMQAIALSGSELRAFIEAVKAGAFDEVAGAVEGS